MDIKELDKYKKHLSDFYKVQVDARVVNYGRYGAWEKHLVWLNCTRRFPDGSRIIQVNSHVYEVEMAQTLYLIDRYFYDIKDEKYAELLKLHNANIEHDKNNPVLDRAKSKQKTPRRKNDGVSAAELKAKAKAMKIGALKFNIKKTIKNE